MLITTAMHACTVYVLGNQMQSWNPVASHQHVEIFTSKCAVLEDLLWTQKLLGFQACMHTSQVKIITSWGSEGVKKAILCCKVKLFLNLFFLSSYFMFKCIIIVLLTPPTPYGYHFLPRLRTMICRHGGQRNKTRNSCETFWIWISSHDVQATHNYNPP